MGAGPGGWSIGEVLGLLLEEFPEVSISKIRFLESKGLISPTRSQGGYRKFAAADVGRLRWILHHQREHYLPLKVIQKRLARLDPATVEAWASGETQPTGAVDPGESGEPRESDDPRENGEPGGSDAHGDTTAGDLDAASLEPTAGRTGFIDGAGLLVGASPTMGESAVKRGSSEPDPPDGTEGARPAATGVAEGGAGVDPSSSGLVRPVGTAVLRLRDLAILSGLDERVLSELDGYGLLPRRPGSPDVLFGEEALVVARLADAFARYGVEPRHLRMYKVFAEREAAFFEQVLPLSRRARSGEERRQVREALADLARLGEELRTSALRTALTPLLET